MPTLHLGEVLVLGALFGVHAPLLGALAEAGRPGALLPQPALPLHDQRRALLSGLAWLGPCLVGALVAIAWLLWKGATFEQPLHNGLRGVALVLPLLVLAAWQGHSRSPAVVPGVLLGVAAAALGKLPTPEVLLGAGLLLVAVQLAGPWLARHHFLWPPSLQLHQRRSGQPRPSGATSRPCPGLGLTLRADAFRGLFAAPLRTSGMAVASLLFAALFIVAAVGGHLADFVTAQGLFSFLVLLVIPAGVMGLLLGAVTAPLDVPARCAGEAGEPAERLARSWERLPVSLREVRLRALLNNLITAAAALVLVWIALAWLDDRPAWAGPMLALVAAAWGAFFPSFTLGDRVTRITAWCATALVCLPLLANGCLDTLEFTDSFFAGCGAAAVVLPLLLLRDTPART